MIAVKCKKAGIPCGMPALKWIAAVPCGTSQRRKLLQLFKCCLYFRFAQVPNAGLGHVQINLPATLGLRICTSCNTLRLGYTKINFRASLALWVFVQVAGADVVPHEAFCCVGRFPHYSCGSGYILGAAAVASLVARLLKRSPATQVSAPRGHYP